MSKSIQIAGASFPDVPAVQFPAVGGGTATFTDVSGTTAQAADVASGKQFFDALGVLTQGTASGGGGASNYVSGTFKGTTTGAAMDVNIPYTGNGYPVAIVVYPNEDYASGETYYDLLQRYAFYTFFAVKNLKTTSPLYEGSSPDDNCTVIVRYKSSATSAASYSGSYVHSALLFNDSDAQAAADKGLRMSAKNKLSVFIASSSYGFAANIEYTYHVIYSS